MTPEQKQRIEQVKGRLAAHKQEIAKYRNHEWAKGDALHYYEAPDDVDLLLSLVKSQEARAFPDPRHWEPVGPPVVLPAPLLPHSYEEYVLGFCPEKGRGNAILSVEGELTLLGKNVVRELSNRVATSMRSACVEKLRSSLYDPSLRFSDEGIKAAITDWTNILIRRLESLSIEKPKE